MKNNIIKTSTTRKYVLILLIALSIILSIGVAIIEDITSRYLDNAIDRSLNLVEIYSEQISLSTLSNSVINNALEDILLISALTIATYDKPLYNEVLFSLSEEYRVDEVYIYNPSGEIIASSSGDFIGWTPSDNDPEASFLNSELNSYVEDIRADVETKKMIKYGYYRNELGYTTQVGIYADNIKYLMDNFLVDNILNNFLVDQSILRICFIDNTYTIVGSTDSGMLGRQIGNEETISSLESLTKDSHIIDLDSINEHFDILIPVFNDNQRIGVLNVRNSLVEINREIRIIIRYGFLVLATIITFAVLFLHTTYKKNKSLYNLAYFDRLTNLPNRQYLSEIIQKDIDKKNHDRNIFTLIQCYNLENFNVIYGYSFGDKIIKNTAAKIKEIVNSNGVFARVTGDRFAIYFNASFTQKDFVRFSMKLNELSNSPVVLGSESFYPCLITGNTILKDSYTSVEGLLKDASISLSFASNEIEKRHIQYDEDLELIVLRSDQIEKILRRNILEEDLGEIFINLQPQYEAESHSIVGVEVLARMYTTELGYVSPLEFIKIAEDNQLMVAFSSFILKKVRTFHKEFVNYAIKYVSIAININGIELLHDKFFNDLLAANNEIIEQGNTLEIEITESTFIESYDLINEKLKSLRDSGVTIAIDDFGKGYSSLYRLRDLHVNKLKLDKSFIDKIHPDKFINYITGDIISLAHKLDLRVVAEGVETPYQLQYLKDNDCDIIQGYLFNRPLSQSEILRLLQNDANFFIEE
jgi:diguanylate cyclase (GGDEF)-like protein